VPDGYYTVPLDKAAIARPGKDVTVLTYGTTVYVSQVAAEETGVDAEVIDLRSLWPLDLETIVESVKKPAAAWWCTKPPAPAASAPSWWRWCRSIASTTWKRRSSASPVGTPLPARAGMGVFPRAVAWARR
jgi:hypothetical protein